MTKAPIQWPTRQWETDMFGQFIFACPTFAATPPVPRRNLNWRDNCIKVNAWDKQAKDVTAWDDQTATVDAWDKQAKDELTNRKCGYDVTPCAGGR